MSQKQLNLLIVEDDAILLETLASFFEQKGFCVQRATTGREALRLYAATPPDITILDLVLAGGKTGLETMLEIFFEHGDVPVVTMSGAEGGNLTWLEASTNFGAKFSIRKPFTPEGLGELIDTIAASLG